jgi:hypothetical protein
MSPTVRFLPAFLVCLLGTSAASFGQPGVERTGETPEARDAQRIQPWAENPRYWQYRGQPVLLLGGSKDDNLFQIPDLEEHLDEIIRAGGNYIRNTMSDRQDKGFEVYPFQQLPDGRYDLDQWNEEYWQRFETMLRGTAKRDIIVQIEVWDRHDFSSRNWPPHPYNPKNNVAYTYEASGFAAEHSEHGHEAFFLTTPKQRNNTVVLKYQQRFVDRVLAHALKYDHVLYCISNETSAAEAWSTYWAEYLRNAATAAGKEICMTEMWNQWDLDHLQHRRTLDHLDGRYNYVEVSQGTWRRDQTHWDRLQWVRNFVSSNPVPVHITKVYGVDGMPSYNHTTADAVANWWRHVIGGAASTRFHRPPYGLGLSEPAVASIRAARKIESVVKFWDVAPANELLSDREPNEAYLTAAPGRAYVLYFPDGGSVGLDLRKHPGRYTLRWIDIATGEWAGTKDVDGGAVATIAAPKKGHRLAVIMRQEN